MTDDKTWLMLGKECKDFRTWDAWNTIHQPFELDWWKDQVKDGAHYADDATFDSVWAQIQNFINPRQPVIDIGCGPRPPFAPCIVIEPLANEYKKFTPSKWWDGVEVHSQPAEDIVPGLSGNTIICWNCIDHAIGWKAILDNMFSYGNLGATFAIATDFHRPFVGHPGFSRLDFMAEIDKRFKIEDQQEPSPCGRAIALRMKARG